jgi:predicted nucleic acid-binding protein
MAVLEALPAGKVYLDTNVFIYAVEAVAEYGTAIGELFRLIDAGTISAVTSELALAEVLAKPFEAGRHDVAEIYQEMLAPSAWLSIWPVERAILIEAARLRPQLTLRLPDAIHVATAVAAGCPALISNDHRLRLPSTIRRFALE